MERGLPDGAVKIIRQPASGELEEQRLSVWMEQRSTVHLKVCESMKILFLHGWHSTPGGMKPSFLKAQGYEVLNPALDDDDFQSAVDVAQAAYDQHAPDVIVGSSRGGAVAMHVQSRDTPLVLLCPAWRDHGWIDCVKPETWILHSRQDEVVAYADSERLLAHSSLSASRLITTGSDHRLVDPDSLETLRSLCEAIENDRLKTA